MSYTEAGPPNGFTLSVMAFLTFLLVIRGTHQQSCNSLDDITIKARPPNRHILSGTTLILQCISKTVRVHSVSWFHNGSAITGYRGANTVNITIDSTKISSSGFYVCLINDDYCNAEKKFIKVIENKITVLVSPNDTEAHAGSRAVFRIQVESYYDLLTVVWRHNNRDICDERRTVRGSAWLSCNISSVSAVDTGHYCVVISSSSGNIESETRCFALHVIERPNEPIKLDCGSPGSDSLSPSWDFRPNSPSQDKLSGFLVSCQEVAGADRFQITVPVGTQRTALDRLKSCTLYNITVQSKGKVLLSNSISILCRTTMPQLKPSDLYRVAGGKVFLIMNGERHPICLTSEGFNVLSSSRGEICRRASLVTRTFDANAAASNSSYFLVELKSPYGNIAGSGLESLLSCSRDTFGPETTVCEDRFQLNITARCPSFPPTSNPSGKPGESGGFSKEGQTALIICLSLIFLLVLGVVSYNVRKRQIRRWREENYLGVQTPEFQELLRKASRTEATIGEVADSIGDVLRSLKSRDVIPPNESEREAKFQGLILAEIKCLLSEGKLDQRERRALEDEIKALRGDIRQSEENLAAKLTDLLGKLSALRPETAEWTPTTNGEISAPDIGQNSTSVAEASASAVDHSVLPLAGAGDPVMSSLTSRSDPLPPAIVKVLNDLKEDIEDRIDKRFEQQLRETKNESEEVLTALSQTTSMIAEQEWNVKELVLSVTHLLQLGKRFEKIVQKELEGIERQRHDANWSCEKLRSLLAMFEEVTGDSTKKKRDAKESLKCLIHRLEFGERQTSENEKQMFINILYFLLNLNEETMV